MPTEPTKQDIWRLRAESQIEIYFKENVPYMRLTHRPTDIRVVAQDSSPRPILRDKLLKTLFGRLQDYEANKDSILFRKW